MKYLANRLKERSTWISIFGAVSLFGLKVSPEFQDAFINFGLTAAVLAGILIPDNK